MLDSLTEIPLPGRILVSPTKNLASWDAAPAMPAFVAGPENRLVAATFNRLIGLTAPLSAPAEEPARERYSTPNILALFGPTGVGKTHLAHGLVRHWQNAFGTVAACYTTAADFRRLVNESIDANTIAAFRDQYRKHRLLAIDDIHRLPNDGYLMQELRYALDAFEENNRILIVTSHRPTESLANLPADLRSRLASGLTLQLSAPSSEARTRIIRHASSALGREVPTEEATRIANSDSSTAPEVLSRLFKYFSPPAAASACGSEAQNGFQRHVSTIQEIIAAVAKYTNVPQKQLKSASRKQSTVFARAIAVYLAREIAAASYDQIGRALGGRDHTTVMHNYKKITRELTTSVATQEAVADLRRQLTAC